MSAGDFLGYADMRMANDFDIAVLYAPRQRIAADPDLCDFISTEWCEDHYGDFTGDLYWISLFDLMPDSVFAAYETRECASREAMQFSKAEREADPIDDWGGRGTTTTGSPSRSRSPNPDSEAGRRYRGPWPGYEGRSETPVDFPLPASGRSA